MEGFCLRQEENPRFQTGLIRDPIHNYVTYSKNQENFLGEEALLENRWVKRLRRLYQNQGVWFTYPGAVHTRYQHSLGVMELAGEFAKQLYGPFLEKCKKDYGDELEKNEKVLEDKNYVIQVARIAGLLHDIAHGPFSHLFDRKVLKKYSTNHEILSSELIMGELKPIIEGIKIVDEDGKLRPIQAKDVDEILHPYKDNRKSNGFREGLDFWKKPVSQIFHGVYSADNLDYLLRDSYYAGTPEYGTVDAKRLIHRSVFHPGGLAIEEGSRHSLYSFIVSRMLMYQTVYYHKKVRIFELMLGDVLGRLSNTLGLFDEAGNINLEVYYSLDDQFVLSLGAYMQADLIPQHLREIAEKIHLLTSQTGSIQLVEAYAFSRRVEEFIPLLEKLFKEEVIRSLVEKELRKEGKERIIASLRFDTYETFVIPGDPLERDEPIFTFD